MFLTAGIAAETGIGSGSDEGFATNRANTRLETAGAPLIPVIAPVAAASYAFHADASAAIQARILTFRRRATTRAKEHDVAADALRIHAGSQKSRAYL